MVRAYFDVARTTIHPANGQVTSQSRHDSILELFLNDEQDVLIGHSNYGLSMSKSLLGSDTESRTY